MKRWAAVLGPLAVVCFLSAFSKKSGPFYQRQAVP